MTGFPRAGTATAEGANEPDDAGAGPSSSAGPSLSASLTSFVGRETELAEIAELARGSRMLTITGAAGIGKTRLAIEVAGRLPSAAVGPVHFVGLGGLTDGALVPHAVAGRLGVGERAGERLARTVARAIGARRLLLLLDSCEHVVDAVANLVEAALGECPHLRVVATSRQRLRVPGEVVWRLGPLGLPAAGPGLELRAVLESESVRLFAARARLLAPDFMVDGTSAAAVARICRQLDGIPLAIELAAARVEVMSVQDILDNLEDRFRLLTGGHPRSAPRHRTLHAALDWGHELLDPGERVLFRRISVFSGGLDVAAAEAVCSGPGLARDEAPSLVFALVEKSLLTVVAGSAGPTRYHMLDTIRQFAAARLAESGEEEAVAEAHARYYLALAERAEAQQRSPDQYEWLERLNVEHDNLRTAFDWWSRHDAAARLRLASSLTWFWITRGHVSEGREWLEAALAAPTPDAGARARGLLGLSGLDFWRGDYDAARSLCDECLALFQRQGDTLGCAWAQVLLGSIHMARGEYPESRSQLEEALANSPDPIVRMEALVVLGEMLLLAGEVAEARSHLEQVATVARGPEAPRGRARLFLGVVAFFSDDRAAADRYLAGALEIFRRLGNRYAAAAALDACAGLAVADSAPLRALRLAGAANAIRRSTGAELAPRWQRLVEAVVTGPAFAAAGGDGAAAWAEGELLTLDDAILLATVGLGPGSEATGPDGTSRRTRPGGLSARELEVADLVGLGMTNRQIADRLRIAERTVEGHVERIRGKLNVRSRTQVATAIARLRAWP
ncbi:MAG TPA: LuxR C-terminal-related transcriptional regulator [Candidatus Dormibacteraeota bacterium]|nr:LuxR C-terminal-related transcriptional regulator [Candidatus Dormibacteraeota bacterium]